MQAAVVHILPLTSIRRERLLPAPGRVTARVDQKVSLQDVVAETSLGQEHLLIDVAGTLGLAAEAAQQLIQVKAGERVAKDQPLAQKKGFIRQVVRAPASGRVILAGSGRILMETGEGNLELRAGIPGRVTHVITERGVEITFNGALVQGVWGNGRLGLGLMIPVLTLPDEPLHADKMDVSLRGSILLAGHCSDPAALQAAGDLPVRGLIVGSLSPLLIPLALQMPYPIVVIDGFGLRPMDDVAYKLLTTSAKREVSLNAEPFVLQTGVRPEIYIPLPVSEEPPLPRELQTFAPDQSVRLRRAPKAGAVGTLTSLLPGLTTMPSGLRVAAAEVNLSSGEQIIVPLANLEILG